MAFDTDRNKLNGILLLALGCCAIAPLCEARAAGETGTLSLSFENDLFYDNDRNYTNGVRIAWVTGPDSTPAWATRFALLFPLFPEGGRVRTEYALAQNMYTPADITLPNPPQNDRPYAGWLHGSVGVISETGNQLDQLGLSLGMVGPASLADETQKLVHRVVGSPKPQGWGAQLDNEPTLMLTYQRSWRRLVAQQLFGQLSYDITPHAGVALGNVFSYANTGVTLRIGSNMPLDYGPPRIQPSLPGSGFFIPGQGFGWYLFAGLDGRAVARNLFLDGNTFENSRSVDKKPVVGDLQFGIALNQGDYRLSYTHVLRTREFHSQVGGDDFGSLSLSIRF